MDNLKEKLVELIRETPHIHWNASKLPHVMADYLIAHGVTIQQWISVEERLPDNPMKCFVYTKRGKYSGYEITYYNQGFYVQYCEVTHWMPLPEPPKGE